MILFMCWDHLVGWWMITVSLLILIGALLAAAFGRW